MHRDTNRQIIEEINACGSLTIGPVVGENDSVRTKVTSLGKIHSVSLGRDLDLALKEYDGKRGDSLNMRVACELGLMDLVERNLPHLIWEFPLIHGVFLDLGGKPIGVITEDYSRGGTVPVTGVGQDRKILPYELQNLFGKPTGLDDLATTAFLVDGLRRIGDFGEFIPGDSMEMAEFSRAYFNRMDSYSVKVNLKER